MKPPAITILPDPDPVATLSLKWQVILDEECIETNPNNQDGCEVLYALTEEGYEAAALNLASFTRWAREMRDLVKFYVTNIQKQQEDTTSDKPEPAK